ncbi:hypothetical protein FHY55_19335 [Oceanicola sp. D3]|uniref:hypothetical protein n=1 Tax=Oceanicola sp. D3 TaxID=2587163 RepID=UPI001121E874|nr:hypothetical protein [Oceanicola sp. D3]QDC11252.1 hypothetical protein FHY55_19335 [Oceanicola sp. D3]
MTRTKLTDLNDHLFAQLERLGDESLTAEQIETEAKRAASIVEIADQITESTKLRLGAAKLFAEHGANILPHLPMIGKSDEPTATE